MAAISSARVVLLPSAPADCDDIIALHRDPRVTAYLIDGIPDDERKTALYFDWASQLQTRGLGPWTARRRGDGQFLGLFTLTPWGDGDTTLEFGGRLARAAWAGDLAVEAGAAVIDHAFAGIGCATLVSLHHPLNPTAPVALARLGFDRPAATTLYGAAATEHRLDRAQWDAQGRQALPRRRRG